MNHEIGIIIPVFNSENYILNLLDILSKQTIQNFKVLIIDDGSIDSTNNICSSFCNSHKKFHLYTKKNGGAASARNFGIELCDCELILFVDSDDLVTKNFVEKFYNAYLETNADLISFKIFVPNEKERAMKKTPLFLYNKNDIFNAFFVGDLGVGPTSKLFKKSVIGNLRFNENLLINEDKLFLFNYICKCSSLYVSFKKIYFVQRRSDSVSNSVNYSKKTNDLYYVQESITSSSDKCFSDYFKNHNLVTYLYIYKIYLNSVNFVTKDKTFIKEIETKIKKNMNLKGRVKFKTRLEVIGFLYFNKLYNFTLKKYYLKGNKK